MNCEAARGGLDELVDGEPRPDLEAHLAGCPGCREEARRLGALKARLAELPDAVPVPADLWPEVAVAAGLSGAVERAAEARATVSAPFRRRARALVAKRGLR